MELPLSQQVLAVNECHRAEVRQGDGKAVGEAKAEQDDEAMDYLLKPSPPFVAGWTLGVAIAKATAVAKIRMKQLLTIPLAGKLVAGPCMMTMPPCVLYRGVGPRSRTGEHQESLPLAIDSRMKTFHEWLAVREGLWLKDKNAVIGLARLNPLPKNSAMNKCLAKKSKPQPSACWCSSRGRPHNLPIYNRSIGKACEDRDAEAEAVNWLLDVGLRKTTAVERRHVTMLAIGQLVHRSSSRKQSVYLRGIYILRKCSLLFEDFLPKVQSRESTESCHP